MFKMISSRIVIVLALVQWYTVTIGGATAVSSTTCTANGKECEAISNAVCGGSSCKCNDGYKEITDKCDQVFGSGCTVVGNCTGLANAACTNGKCACATDYAVKNKVCVKVVSATVCTTGGSQCPNNAECETTKCKCSEGFQESADACTKSGAVSVNSAVGLMFGSLLVLVLQAL